MDNIDVYSILPYDIFPYMTITKLDNIKARDSGKGVIGHSSGYAYSLKNTTFNENGENLKLALRDLAIRERAAVDEVRLRFAKELIALCASFDVHSPVEIVQDQDNKASSFKIVHKKS